MRIPAFLAISLLIPAAGCTGAVERQSDPFTAAPRTTVEVDNRTNLNAAIYVFRNGGHRQRVGTATSLTRTRMRVPDRMLFGVTSIRFQADPIGSRGTPVSQTITVTPGETIVLTLMRF